MRCFQSPMAVDRSVCCVAAKTHQGGRQKTRRQAMWRVIWWQSSKMRKSTRKTRYSGHLYSRLLRDLTQRDQTDAYSYYMGGWHWCWARLWSTSKCCMGMLVKWIGCWRWVDGYGNGHGSPLRAMSMRTIPFWAQREMFRTQEGCQSQAFFAERGRASPFLGPWDLLPEEGSQRLERREREE